MKTLVTGGAGFIGSHLVDLLITAGHQVTIVDNLSTGYASNLHPAARFYQLDIRRPDLKQLLAAEAPEVVFHEAAQMSVKVSTDDPQTDADINVLGLLNVLEGCVEVGVRKIVYASSGATYGNPDALPIKEASPQRPESPYGITKLMGEHYLAYYARDHGIRYAALRYGNVYGPRQDSWGEAGVVAIFARELLSGQQPVIHWDGEQVRDYVAVTDVARANLAAAERGADGCYGIATGIGTSVNRLYALLCQATGVDVEPARSQRRAGDLRAAYFDVSYARSELGWQPTVELEAGLATTVEWFRAALSAAPVPA